MTTRNPEPQRRTELQLQAGRPLRLTRARGRSVTAVAGIVWITVEGFADDVFLHAGESFTIPGDGLTLVEAIAGARVDVDTPDTAGRAENRGKPDLSPDGRIKSAVPFRLPTALSVSSVLHFRVLRCR